MIVMMQIKLRLIPMVSPQDTMTLTVPCEDWMEVSTKRKKVKYADLVEEWNTQGWRARCPLKLVEGRILRLDPLQSATISVHYRSPREADHKHSTDAAEKASRWRWLRMSSVWSALAGVIGWEGLRMGVELATGKLRMLQTHLWSHSCDRTV